MKITVNDLLALLEEAEQDGLGDAEVRIATQPNWPLQFRLGGIALRSDALMDDPDDEPTEEQPEIVYLVEGGQCRDTPYAPRGIWDNVRRA